MSYCRCQLETKSLSGINTEYTEVTTARAGYLNGYYAADGAFLGYDNETNPTKAKIYALV